MSSELWTASELCDATAGELRGEAFIASAVSIDSRTLPQGALFVALPGEHFDGHEYIAKAAQQGAVGAIVQHEWAAKQSSLPLPCVVVEDCYAALDALAKASRRRSKAKVIGVTGSVGKTSAKEMLKLCLSAYGSAYATSGNYNNHIGLPLTMANMPVNTDYAILEMGMNHAGEIDLLSRLAEPDVAVITTVEAVHLEFFDSVADIARAKSEIMNGLVEGGAVILPRDNQYYAELLNAAKQNDVQTVRTFGAHEESNMRLVASACSIEGTEVDYQCDGNARHFQLGTLGAHWPKASLAVLAAVDALGLPLEKAEEALASYAEQPGRGALVHLPWQQGELTLIDDAYNASPVSMKASLETVGKLQLHGSGQRKAILGHMLELGESAPEFHAELATDVVKAGITQLLLVGDLMQHLAEKLPAEIQVTRVSKAEEGSDWLSSLRPQDILLCKGSHGSGVYKLVETLYKLSEERYADAI